MRRVLTGNAPNYQFWWLDRRSYIFVRGRRAVSLGFLQFAVLDALHSQGRRRGYQLATRLLLDRLYNGTADPKSGNVLHQTVRGLNVKLRPLQLKVQGVNRKQNSFYKLVQL